MSNPQALRMLHRAAWRLAAGQIALTLVIALVAGWIGNGGSAWSALAGGGIGTAAGLYQALRMFSVSAADEPERFMRAVYVGEFMKIVITAALFVAVIRIMKPQFLPMMAAYAATFFVYWAALGTGYPWFGSGLRAEPAGSPPGQRMGDDEKPGQDGS
jgi:ATP synthase protein I